MGKETLAGESAVSDVIISRVIGKPVFLFDPPILADNRRAAGACLGIPNPSQQH